MSFPHSLNLLSSPPSNHRSLLSACTVPTHPLTCKSPLVILTPTMPTYGNGELAQPWQQVRQAPLLPTAPAALLCLHLEGGSVGVGSVSDPRSLIVTILDMTHSIFLTHHFLRAGNPYDSYLLRLHDSHCYRLFYMTSLLTSL